MALTERYVTADAGGTGDGSSGNPWTLTQAISGAAAGDRINVKAGAYSQGTATTPNGTAAAPIIWRGYNGSTITNGYQGRADSGTGALVTTNFPDLELTGVLTLGTYNEFQCFDFYGALNSQLITLGSYNKIIWCNGLNNHTNGAAATTISPGTNYSAICDCDLRTTSTSNSSMGLSSGRYSLSLCRVKCDNGIAANTIEYGGGAFGCIVFDSWVGIKMGAGAIASNCSFNNITNGAIRPDGSANAIINCVGYDCKYLIENVTAAKPALVINCAFGGAKTGGARWLNQGDQPEYGDITLTGSPFASSSDFRLNYTSGAGASCRGAGKWPYFDLGALQIVEPVIPSSDDVRSGVAFGDNSATNGAIVVPARADVRLNTEVDQSMGLLDLPAEADVKDGVKYDSETKEGTLASSGLIIVEDD